MKLWQEITNAFFAIAEGLVYHCQYNPRCAFCLQKMSRKIKSVTHSQQLLTGVAGLLTDTTHKYSDIQLTVGGNVFHCHKVVLALKSAYFEPKLFPSSPPAAATSEQIVLNDVMADDFHKVLQFIYTGETELNEENVENILRAAELMKLTELTQFCVDFLVDTVPPEMCPRYWKLAEQMNLATLALACKRQCLKEFGEMRSSSETLGSLSEAMMRELLEDDELQAESEVDVCETLMKWLHNSQTHSVQPYQLLTPVRWSAVPLEYVKTKLIANEILMRDRRCFEFLSKVICYRLTGVQFSGLNTFLRPSTGVEQCVVIVGLNTGPDISSGVLRVSLQRQDHVTNAHAIPTKMQPELAACVSGKELYVSGAGSSKNESWKWESAFGWTRCADMNEGRRRHCATFVNSTSMYVLGGFVTQGQSTLDSVEQYNTVTNKWTTVGQLTHATCGAACAVYKMSIYVFGGIGQDDEYVDRVQVFDTATKLCTELTHRLPRPEPLLRAVMWDKSVILINGRTCLIFDLEQQTFQQRDQFAAGVIHFGLVLENQRIFAIGGGTSQAAAAGQVTWTMSDEVKSVAVTDIISSQTTANWLHHATLPQSALVHACASMTLTTT